MYKKVLIIGLMTLCFGCNSNKPTDRDESVISFDRKDIPKQVVLHDPEEIVFEDLLNPAAFYVVYDTLVVVQNQPNCDYMIEMYSLNGKTLLGQFAQRGGGPDDFLQELHLQTEIIPVGEEDYIGYNFWYVNSDKYSNNVPALK
ncbi:MAG: hypothetical protein LBK58_04635, partial [Prevotellaceae bacterium]|nr:hypothetical protein [Prevotellaceae bacterium]